MILNVDHERNAWLGPEHPDGRRWVLYKLGCGADRPSCELTAAIEADKPKLFRCTIETEGALECANIGLFGIGR